MNGGMFSDMNWLSEKEELRAAIVSQDETKFSEALTNLFKKIDDDLVARSQNMTAEQVDRYILQERGQDQLTKEERNYYNQVIEKRGFENLDVVMPTTTFDRVFEDLEKNHPLLSKIDFQNATGLIKWIVRDGEVTGAVWGPLTGKIKEELSNGFHEVGLTLAKLTAFIPVSKAMLDLGPVWLDRFVRLSLSESISIGLEMGIVAGTGKDQPVGMLKNLKGSVVEGVYPDKDSTPLPDLSPTTLSKIVVKPLTKDGTVNVNTVLIVLNPFDYWDKFFPATTFLSATGAYVHDVLPIPADVVTSVAVPKGKLIAGIAKNYFMGIGSNKKIEYSDEVKFLDDERVYIAKQYANGMPKDNDSFQVFDITNLSTQMLFATGNPSTTPAAFNMSNLTDDEKVLMGASETKSSKKTK